MRRDVVVIGAGVSGIATAITMARNGRQVTLVEKAGKTAPLLRGFSRRGVHFDTGFHYTGGLGPGEPLDVLFRYLGISDRVESFPFDQDGFDLFRCEDPAFEFRVPFGFRRLQEKLAEAFPGERGAIGSYLEQVRKACAAMPYLNLDVEIGPDSALPRIMGKTLRETLDGLTGNELLKSLLSMHCLLYGVPSSEVSFAQHAAIVGTYYDSVRGIRGGGLSLARAFDERLAELGVEVILSREATGIEAAADGSVSGVRLADGELLPCSTVVATLHPRLLLEIAPEGAFRPAYRQRLGALEETISAFICFATSDGPLPSLAGSNRFLLPDIPCIHDLGTQPLGEAPLYLSAAYRQGESQPAGFVAISPTLFSEAGSGEGKRRPEGYRRYKEEGMERIRAQVARAYPELAGSIDYLEGSTPLTIRDYCATPLGGLYGVKHMVGQYNPHPSTRVPGLYLAGQAVVAPGVMGAMLSGFLACGTILGHDLLRKELKACC